MRGPSPASAAAAEDDARIEARRVPLRLMVPALARCLGPPLLPRGGPKRPWRMGPEIAPGAVDVAAPL